MNAAKAHELTTKRVELHEPYFVLKRCSTGSRETVRNWPSRTTKSGSVTTTSARRAAPGSTCAFGQSRFPFGPGQVTKSRGNGCCFDQPGRQNRTLAANCYVKRGYGYQNGTQEYIFVYRTSIIHSNHHSHTAVELSEGLQNINVMVDTL